MVDEFKKYVKNSTGVVVAVFIFLFAQFVFVISWGTQQASRITALETLTTQNGAIIRTWAEFSRGLGERVDRQETPLSRRVDALDLRVGVLSERSVRMDSFMLEIQREIQQRR